jgi:hypothetical protein
MLSVGWKRMMREEQGGQNVAAPKERFEFSNGYYLLAQRED